MGEANTKNKITICNYDKVAWFQGQDNSFLFLCYENWLLGCQIQDTWHVIGSLGNGSKSYDGCVKINLEVKYHIVTTMTKPLVSMIEYT